MTPRADWAFNAEFGEKEENVLNEQTGASFCDKQRRSGKNDGWMSVAVRLKRLLVAAADRQRRCDTERSLDLSAAHSLAMTIIATSKAEQAGRSLTLVKSEPD
ncbi:hypothetical protein TEQG_06629 [Trichophyton equinum CBS 127.97]|uniref:Uncharacterized protein n=1 Tax=Trichophyton equinum (strain ATCC MYA-4606 / CBS 127.97) TaxID=559882 RepID=F2Q0H7_TRIEC|nr:hypothetical protein TEQG_06629 [Trichophyton equinum CBS 127.97]